MPNTTNKSSGGLIAFLLNKKNLPLLLLLLGGGATVVTGTVLLSNPGSNGSESSLSSGGSQTTSVSETSSGQAFSGNEVPEWDLTNATITANGSGFGVSYDYQWSTRYQGDYLYQIGRNLYENAPSADTRYSDYGFSIFNIRTGTLEYQFAFNPGSTFIDYLINNEDSYNDYGNLRMAFDGESTIYVLLTTFVQMDITNADTRLQGNYAPLYNRIVSLGTSVEDRYEFLLQFDMADATSYDILDVRYSDTGLVNETNDILYEGGYLYFATSFSKGALDNPLTLSAMDTYSFMPVPDSYPTFTTVGFSSVFNYVFQFDVTNPEAIEVVSSTAITFDTTGYIYFSGYRQGFETRYFTEDGRMALAVSSNLYATSDAAIETYFDGLEQNFLSESSQGDLYTLAETKFNDFKARNEALVGATVTMNFNLTATGFYNFETSELENALFNSYSWFSQGVNGENMELNNQYSQSYVFMESGDVYLFTVEIFAAYVHEAGFYTSWSIFNPDYLQYCYSKLELIDLDTQNKTLIEENDDNGKYISGIYEKEGGFYVTGNYYETETFTDVQSSDAFLMKTNASFEEVAELIIAGSAQEQSGGIVLDSQARPVWIVYSNSIDGDFAAFAESNPNENFRPYIVSF